MDEVILLAKCNIGTIAIAIVVVIFLHWIHIWYFLPNILFMNRTTTTHTHTHTTWKRKLLVWMLCRLSLMHFWYFLNFFSFAILKIKRKKNWKLRGNILVWCLVTNHISSIFYLKNISNFILCYTKRLLLQLLFSASLILQITFP